MEWKDGRLQLPNVTLMAMTSVNVRQTIKAMQYSMVRWTCGQRLSSFPLGFLFAEGYSVCTYLEADEY